MEESVKKLRGILSEYEYYGEYDIGSLIDFFEEEKLFQFEWRLEELERILSKKEKKLLFNMLSSFGHVKIFQILPYINSYASKFGYGAEVKELVKRFLPKWAVWLKRLVYHGAGILFLFAFWGIGFKFSLVAFASYILIFKIFECFKSIYLQNEYVCRHNNKKAIEEFKSIFAKDKQPRN